MLKCFQTNKNFLSLKTFSSLSVLIRVAYLNMYNYRPFTEYFAVKK